MKYFLSHREGGEEKFAGNRIERARDRVGSRLFPLISIRLDLETLSLIVLGESIS